MPKPSSILDQIRELEKQRDALLDSAIQEAKGVSLAFVRLAEDRYETRRVKLVESVGDQVTLAGGIAPGELVATTGSFLLKTETMKEGIGAGCCELEAPTR